jgi:hypothetical protein
VYLIVAPLVEHEIVTNIELVKVPLEGLSIGVATARGWNTILLVYVPLATKLLDIPLLKALALTVVVLVKNRPNV